ncbi:MAG: Cell shape-determining protein MreC [Anaerolineales bacterium]|jgi:rod shape-determining protein MreC|nr:Cell shape-determining protein MreC [Anaerolineales bacterium]
MRELAGMSKLQTRSILVVVLVLASLGLLGLNQSGSLGPVKGALLAPLTALQKWVAQTWNGAEALFQRSPDAEALRQRNAELEAENARLKAQAAAAAEDRATLSALSQLLDYARTQPENKYLAANVIGLDPSPFLNYLILDRGSDAGVTSGMSVVTDQGLVGRVVEVTATSAKVQLIVDAASAVNALLQASRERGVVVGQLAGGLEMQNISQQTKLAPDDVVLTSGLGGKFPPGVIIGTVNAVQKLNYEVLQKADITPAVDFNRLEIVLIITNFTPRDFSPFFQATPTAPAPAP